MRDPVEYFESFSNEIDPRAEEVTIVGSDIEENLYDAFNCPPQHLDHLKRLMEESFGVSDLSALQQFSYQKPDGTVYDEAKVMVVFSGGQFDCFNYPEMAVVNPHDDYCINYFIESKRRVVKFYDLDVDNHVYPSMPEGSQLIRHWGLGVSQNPEVKDLYFLHRDVRAVGQHFSMPIPYLHQYSEFFSDREFDKVFGLSYRTDTLEPMKLKCYYYPGDPTMESTVFDEVK